MRNEVLEILESLRSEVFFCLVGGEGGMDDVLMSIDNAKKQVEELWSE